MSNGHLIFDGAHFVMRCLFCFTVSQSREVAFNFRSYPISFDKERAVSGNAGAGVIRDIECFCTAVGFTFSEAQMVDRACMRELFS